jgi:hypothetical protein
LTPEELQGCGYDYIQEQLLLLNDKDDEKGKMVYDYLGISRRYSKWKQLREVSETRRRVLPAREGVTAYQNNLD